MNRARCEKRHPFALPKAGLRVNRIVAFLATLATLLIAGPGWAQYAYVGNLNSDSVSVIDTVTDQVIATIPLGAGASPDGIAVLPNGQHVYVVSPNAPNLAVIATATDTVSASLNVGFSPRSIAASPDGSRVYIDNGDETVSVLSTADNSVLGSIPIGNGSAGIAVTPDGSRLYVANEIDSTVTAIATPGDTVLATIAVGSTPIGITASPDSSTIYVANSVDGSVSVISTATNTVVATILGTSTPIGLVVSPDGTRLYVAAESGISVIDTATRNVVDNVAIGNNPYGISITPDGGKIYVANTTDGTVSVMATATDTVVATIPVGSQPRSLGQFIVVVPMAAQQKIAATTLTQSHLAADFTPVIGTGGEGALSYSVAPPLPAGLSLAAGTGAISGTPSVSSAARTYMMTATDSKGATASATFSLTVNPAVTATQAVATSTQTLNRGINPFMPVAGGGGTGALSYSISPAPPTGVNFGTVTDQILGQASVTSPTTTYTVTVTDSLGASASATFQLTVNDVTTATQAVATISLTQGLMATAFTPVTGGGGSQPLSYGLDRPLPPGLSFAAGSGTITGTPTSTSPATTYTVTVTDINSVSASASFSLTVNSAVTATQSVFSTSLTQNHMATAFTPVTGGGGTGGLSYSVAPPLPPGLSMAAGSGAITGIPSAASATASYTVTVTDGNGATASNNFNLTVNTAVAATQALPGNTLTQNHMADSFSPVTGSGGTGSLSYSIAPPLPAGLSLASGNGAITGIPTAASSATTYTVTVTDSNGATASATFSLTINGAVTAIQAIPATSLTQDRAATSFIPITGAGGTGPLSYSIAPSLPAGLTLANGTGEIGGTPTGVSAATTYTMTATDTIGATASATFSLTVNSPVSASQAIASTTLTQSHATSGFIPVTATGGTGTLTYSIAPVLPAGLSLASDSGAITGAATATSSATSYTVTATDTNGATAAANFSLAVNGTVTATQAVASTSLTQSFAAAAFTPVTGAGGTGALSFSVKPGLPAGLGLDAGTGAVTGTPTEASSSTSYTVTVTDTNGANAAASFSLAVNAQVTATEALATTSLALNQAVTSFTPVTGAGGTGTLSYTIKPGLPSGLAFAAGSGAITGTPTVKTAAGSYTVTVTDTNGASASAGFTLAVTFGTSATTASSSLDPASYGQSVTFSATVTGAGSAGLPTGTVTFQADGAPLATVPLSAGGAHYTTAALTAGAHAITALYSGDDNFAGSSANLTEIVTGTSAAADQVYAYQTTLGASGVAGADNAHFDNPAGIAVDSANGHVLVADNGNSRVQILDSTTLTVLATLGVTGVPGNDNEHFDQPDGIGIDSATSRLFVADQANQRVQIFDTKSLGYLATLGVSGVGGSDNGHFNQPSSARIDPAAHRLYVVDQGNDRVQVFDAGTLDYLTTLGTTAEPGNDNTHFNRPTDAALDPIAGQILIADSGNARIQRFDATSLGYAGSLGSAGNPTGDSAFMLPVAAAFDPNTNLVLVADAGANERVQALDALSYGYITSLGTSGSAGRNNDQFAGPASIAADPAHRRLFVSDAGNNRIQIFTAAPQTVFAATLPGARAVEIGRPATIFASVINAGAEPVGPCRVALPVTAPTGLRLDYQTTDAATNALTGTADTPVMIAGNNGLQSFLISFEGGTPFAAAAMPLDFACEGAAPATVTIGVDTADLAMSTAPVADIIALAATATGNGVVTLPVSGTGAFAVASDNVGVAGDLLVSVDTGTAQLPLTATLCPSDPRTGQCLITPAAAVPVSIAAGATPTFSVFVQSAGPIAFDPANARIFVRFKDADGGMHGSTSVAVETE